MSKECFVAFHQDRPAKHPVRNIFLHHIEITDLPETPGAADSSIARFKPSDASLSKDACGVTLRLANGDESVFGWPMIAEARNVPNKSGK